MDCRRHRRRLLSLQSPSLFPATDHIRQEYLFSIKSATLRLPVGASRHHASTFLTWRLLGTLWMNESYTTLDEDA